MKRFITLALAIIMCVTAVVTFAACSSGNQNEDDSVTLKIGKEYDPGESQLDTLIKLNAKSADVAVIDSVMAGYYMSQDSKYANSLKIVEDLDFAAEQYGIAARKGSALIYYVNKTLVELANDGTLDRIAEKYGLKNEVCVDKTYTAEEPTDKSDWEYIKGQGKVIIGYTLFAPIAYEENGQLIGFDIELAKAVFAKLGVEVQFDIIVWETKEASLESKSIDLIWNGLTINDERKAAMEISVPYLTNKQVAVVRKADADKYVSVESMKDAIATAEAGSAGEKVIKG